MCVRPEIRNVEVIDIGNLMVVFCIFKFFEYLDFIDNFIVQLSVAAEVYISGAFKS